MNKKISFLNGITQPAKIYIEPWGEEKVLQAGSKISINFEGITTEGDQIEIEYTQDGIVVYCPTGSKAEFLE